MDLHGRFIVLEGTDGSGKGEQTKLLVERLEKEGYKVATFDFPQYGKPSAIFVEKYLRGEFGSLSEIGPEKASIFYALDRFDASFAIKDALAEGKVVVSNRFTSSNLGHQGSKLKGLATRVMFYEWARNLEFKTLGIPKPDLNILLHVSAETSQKLVDKKSKRDYLRGKKRDIHEGDLEHLRRTEEVYLELLRVHPREFRLVECMGDGKILGIPKIHRLVWKAIASHFF